MDEVTLQVFLAQVLNKFASDGDDTMMRMAVQVIFSAIDYGRKGKLENVHARVMLLFV